MARKSKYSLAGLTTFELDVTHMTASLGAIAAAGLDSEDREDLEEALTALVGTALEMSEKINFDPLARL